MLKINYYISGHGFGHATRAAQIISALIDSNAETRITIITTAPAHLFPVSPRLTLIRQDVDSAIIQPQPYFLDAPTSFANLHAFLAAAKESAWQSRAQDILRASECNLILADAPYPVAWAQHACGIPSILISNFSFDAIFQLLATYLKPAAVEEGKDVLQEIEKLYATYDYVIRLPGYIDFPFVNAFWSEDDRKTRLVDAPLVFRPPRSGREDVLDILKIPTEMRDKKILLVQFGGQVLDSSSVNVPRIPEGWICVSAFDIKDTRFFKFPSDIYTPDLVAISDVVLGKIGYGSVSECLGMNKALVYVLRPMFAEEPGMLEYMDKNGVCKEISVEDYENGDWTSAIESVLQEHQNWKHIEQAEGSAEVAQIIQKLVKKKR